MGSIACLPLDDFDLKFNAKEFFLRLKIQDQQS